MKKIFSNIIDVVFDFEFVATVIMSLALVVGLVTMIVALWTGNTETLVYSVLIFLIAWLALAMLRSV